MTYMWAVKHLWLSGASWAWQLQAGTQAPILAELGAQQSSGGSPQLRSCWRTPHLLQLQCFNLQPKLLWGSFWDHCAAAEKSVIQG